MAVNVDQSLRVGPLPAEIAIAVRGEGFADFVRTVFASLYGELDLALVADIERRRTLDQDVFSGSWTPLHLAQPEWFVSRVQKFFSA